MKVRSCFVHVPESAYTPVVGLLKPGKYTMYYYGPSATDDSRTIVETRTGILTTVPNEWVKLISTIGDETNKYSTTVRINYF